MRLKDHIYIFEPVYSETWYNTL